MVSDNEGKRVTEEKAEGTGAERIPGGPPKPDPSHSMEENLEKLAELNLSTDQSLQPRYSTSIIRLVSALAGIGTLVLIYFLLKLFV